MLIADVIAGLDWVLRLFNFLFLRPMSSTK